MVTGRKINMNLRELKSIETVVSRKQARRGVMWLVENRWSRCELAVAGQKINSLGRGRTIHNPLLTTCPLAFEAGALQRGDRAGDRGGVAVVDPGIALGYGV